MKAKVITIMHNSSSIDVAERCIASGKKHGVTVKWFRAITPNDEPLELLEREGIPPSAFDERYSRNLNCISAFLSHYSLWKECASGEETYAIFEHDAVITAPLPTQPFHYVMNIGHPSYGNWNTPTLIGVNQLTTKRYFPGAHAYMVTPAGAKKLVEAAPQLARPTDIYLNLDNFPWLQEYYPFCAEAQDSFTTIQVEEGCLAKHNWKKGYNIIDA
mgnify:CR=1 FL=1|jgi:GR25 family glycosyltransferase involved in LPS biosynthesis